MAYIDPLEEDKDKEQAQGGLQQSGDSAAITSGASQGGATGDAGATAQKRPANWTNLQDYIGANSAASGEMGQKIEGGANSKIAETSKQQADYQTAAQGPAYDKTKDASSIAGLGQGPKSIADNAEYVANLAKSVYGGPEDQFAVDGYQPTNASVNNLADTYQDVQSVGGRGQALQDTYGQGQKYNLGENTLDAYLVGSGEGQQNLQNIQTNVGKQKDNWQKVLGDVSSSISANKQYVGDTSKSAREALTSAGTSVGQQIVDAKTALDKTNASNDAARNSVLNGVISKDPITRSAAFKAAGIDPEVGEFLTSLGMNMQQFITSGTNQGLGNVLTPDQQAAYKALAKTGMSGLVDRDFETTKATDTPFSLKQDLATAGKSLKTSNDTISELIKQKQAERDSVYNNVLRYATPGVGKAILSDPTQVRMGAQLLGISPEDYKLALSHDVDLTQLVHKGTQLNAGDVATDSDRANWNALASKLGISNNQFNDTQDEGEGYSTDVSAILDAIRASKAPASDDQGNSSKYAGTDLMPSSMMSNAPIDPAKSNKLAGKIQADDRQSDPLASINGSSASGSYDKTANQLDPTMFDPGKWADSNLFGTKRR